MTTGGPTTFAQPLNQERPVLDGVVLLEAVPFQRAMRSSGASILEMWDGSAVIQLDYQGTGESQVPSFFAWSFVLQAVAEADWLKIAEVRAAGLPVWWVPYDAISESFLAATGDTAFTLRRPIAEAKYPAFDTTANPHKAWLNGVAQTIVTSAPSAGEVQLVGSDVTTPALTGGDQLTVRYYPAFAIVVAQFDEALSEFNDLRRTVTLIEANRQLPA